MLMLVLAACAAPRSGASDSPTYNLGFGDGCASASVGMVPAQSPTRRDEELYTADADYRAGWISGRAACGMGSQPPPPL